MSGTGPAIRGVWASVLLDIDVDGTPRFESIADQVAAYAAAGVDGVYCNGTATEFHCQTDDQFRRVSEATAKAALAVAVPFQIAASHPLPQQTLERVALARDLRPTAIQVVLPDWTPIRADEAVRFMQGCAEAAGDTPLVLYNPPHAKTVLTPQTLSDIARAVPSVIGLKCAGGDSAWYAAMQPVLKRWSVFIPGHHYASGLAAGAHGSYSNMACLNPRGAVAWAALCHEDPAAALVVERAIAAFMAESIAPILAAGHFGHACDKAMATAGGWLRITPRMMWPYAAVSDQSVAAVRAAAGRHIPAFLAA